MLKEGAKIKDYILMEYLGGGTFGEVWRAEKRTEVDSSEFALKFLRPKHGEDRAKDIERVRKELKIWKRVSGLANIVAVIEADVVKGQFYIVSEFADGGSLEKYLEEQQGKPVNYGDAVRIIREVLKGLENLHSQSVIHRDLKPANILIKKGVPCLADFGVSWEVKTMSATSTKTGTLQYMPPEAFEKQAKVSPHTDIWATGVIFQQLLCGRLAFPQDSEPALLAGILFGHPEPLPAHVPRGLSAIVEKALQKKREDRFQTAREMLDQLDTVWRSLQSKSSFETLPIVDSKQMEQTLQLDGIPSEWQLYQPNNPVVDEEAEKRRRDEENRLWLEGEVRRKQEADALQRTLPNANPESSQVSQETLLIKETKEVHTSGKTKEPQIGATLREVNNLPEIIAAQTESAGAAPSSPLPNPSPTTTGNTQKKLIIGGVGVGAVAILATVIGVITLNPLGSLTGPKKPIRVNSEQTANLPVSETPPAENKIQNPAKTPESNKDNTEITPLRETPKPKNETKQEKPVPTPKPRQENTPPRESAPPPTPVPAVKTPKPAATIKKPAVKPTKDPNCIFTGDC